MKKKTRKRMHELKYKIAIAMALGCSSVMNELESVSAALGDNANKLANTSQSEALGLAEALGLVGVVAIGILLFAGQRELAKKIGVGVLGGYFILKYAQPIWNTISGGV